MDGTVQQLLARLRQSPTDSALITTLSARCEQTGDYQTLVVALEQHARALEETGEDPIALGSAHYALGNLFRVRLSDPERALAHYQAAVESDAAQRPAMAAARGIYGQLGQWEDVVRLLSHEAESLPAGQKRATVLSELSRVYRDRLGQLPEALNALREAAATDPLDLQVRHDLATLLLDLADQDAGSEPADAGRREAADVLCEMAGAVSDDYAFAYLEAALDAVPDHGRGLALLEEVAPRVGRSDTIPPRWVAGLQMDPLGPLSRDLRLKLATAYRDVGQVDDARAALDPLLENRDSEAQTLAASLFATQPGSDEPDEGVQPFQLGANPLPLTTSTQEVTARTNLNAAATVARAAPISALVAELSALDPEEQEVFDPSSRSLDDLAVVQPSRPPMAEEPVDLLSSIETSLLTHMDEPESEGESTRKALLADRPKRPREQDAEVAASPTGAELGLTPPSAISVARLMDTAQSEERRRERRALQATPVTEPRTQELLALRDDMGRKRQLRDLRGASEVAEAILAHDPVDAEAIQAIEDFCRAGRDFRRMRELALRLGNEPGLPLGARLSRLREAYVLSESKLNDLEGVVQALSAILALAPLDAEAFSKLSKLLTRQQRWNELVDVLRARADATTNAGDKAEILREITLIHRDKRGQLDDAITAILEAREAFSGHAPDAEMLSDLLMAAARFSEAAVQYEARLEATPADDERAPMLRLLAEMYQTHVPDPERASEHYTELLRIFPEDAAAADALEQIDEQLGRFDRLLENVVRRSKTAIGPARASLLARAAEIARTKLDDVAGATELYASAFTCAPGDEALVAAAELAFEQAGLGAEWTRALDEQARQATDRTTIMFLRRKVAVRLAATPDLDGAIEAYQALLSMEVEVGTLRELIAVLKAAGSHHMELAQALDTLASRVDGAEARDLRFARASLLASELGDPQTAKQDLRAALKHAAGDKAALALLAELGERTDDPACLAEAQEQQLLVAESDEARIELLRSLADLYEQRLDDPDKAITALHGWAKLEPANPQPQLRLVALLEQGKRFEELRAALDALATQSIADDDEATEFLLRSAKISVDALGDYEGAWQRLAPRVVDTGDPAAEEALRELARVSRRGEQLAELFVGLAQRAGDDKAQTRRWMDAANAYEMLVGSVDKALEAALRAFAKETSNLALLDEVDRLGVAAEAWTRLAQVYDALARRSDSVEAATRVLLRHAAILEHRAHQPAQAFDRVGRAFSLAPGADDVYAEACRLGTATGRTHDLVMVHERHAVAVVELGPKIDALMEACRLAQHGLEDVARATGNLARAVAAAEGDASALDRIEQMVKEFDAQQPPLDGRGLTRALCEVYSLRADEVRANEKLGAELFRRGASLLEASQHDLDAAYTALARAASLTPTNEGLLDALVDLATRANKFAALATHLRQAADEAIDSNTASLALRRLAALYEGRLASSDKAAAVFRQLVILKPRDLEIADRLRACLKAAGYFKELLAAIDRQLQLVTGDEARIALLEEAAETWESGFGNRYEARDAWRKILSLRPDHEAAARAIARLGTKSGPTEADLLEAQPVVSPEDLRPTAPPSEPASKPSSKAKTEAPTRVESAPPLAEMPEEDTLVTGSPDDVLALVAAVEEAHTNDLQFDEPTVVNAEAQTFGEDGEPNRALAEGDEPHDTERPARGEPSSILPDIHEFDTQVDPGGDRTDPAPGPEGSVPAGRTMGPESLPVEAAGSGAPIATRHQVRIPPPPRTPSAQWVPPPVPPFESLRPSAAPPTAPKRPSPAPVEGPRNLPPPPLPPKRDGNR